MRLTQKEISKLVLPRGKSEVIYFDDDLAGFGLRLRASGAARWVYQYKVGPKHRRMTLDNLKSVKPDQMRHARRQKNYMRKSSRGTILPASGPRSAHMRRRLWVRRLSSISPTGGLN